ncbi:hypothetical protein FQN60_018313, partial [Etheostoma spectabile]
MMWMWRSVLCVSLVSGLALDSNTIRSSKETTQQSSELPDRSYGDPVDRPVRRRTETTFNSNRGQTPPCSTPDCSVPQRGGCSNRAQRRPSLQDRQVDRQRDRETDSHINIDGFNRTKAGALVAKALLASAEGTEVLSCFGDHIVMELQKQNEHCQ